MTTWFLQTLHTFSLKLFLLPFSTFLQCIFNVVIWVYPYILRPEDKKMFSDVARCESHPVNLKFQSTELICSDNEDISCLLIFTHISSHISEPMAWDLPHISDQLFSLYLFHIQISHYRWYRKTHRTSTYLFLDIHIYKLWFLWGKGENTICNLSLVVSPMTVHNF